MTESQKKFAYAYTVEGKCRSEAYRSAYPGAVNMTARQVSDKANKVMQSSAVKAEIARLKELYKETEIITRNELLLDIKELIEVAKENSYEKVCEEGIQKYLLVPKAADIYLKAIDRAAKLIGADEPQKTQNEITVSLDGDIKKYGC